MTKELYKTLAGTQFLYNIKKMDDDMTNKDLFWITKLDLY